MKVRALPKPPIAAAVKYLDNHWAGLGVFLENPRVPLSTNGVELKLRGVALGRNNHFGSRSLLGTQVSANLYSIIETAKLNGFASDEYMLKALNYHHLGKTIPLPHELRLGIDPDSPHDQQPPRGPPEQLPLL